MVFVTHWRLGVAANDQNLRCSRHVPNRSPPWLPTGRLLLVFCFGRFVVLLMLFVSLTVISTDRVAAVCAIEENLLPIRLAIVERGALQPELFELLPVDFLVEYEGLL